MRTQILILIILSNIAYSQITEEWVQKYSGPQPNGAAEPQAIAVDLNGNIYVAGSASTPSVNGVDYATIKYSNEGSVLWIKTYDGTNLLQYIDIATDIVVDVSGNVFVTGKSRGTTSLFDYATIKYDSDGNELWVQRYNAGNFDDEASSIAIDPLGNVYITGWTKSSFSSTFIYTTIKYNSGGDQLWVADYNGPGNGNDFARSIAVDNMGNVYVTGESMGLNNKNEYATIKYDTNGNEIWVKRYSGPESENSMAYCMALDDAANVYVTGSSYIYYATIKYNSDGNELWAQRYGAEISYDKANAIAVDEIGNVYVTGQSFGVDSEFDYATIKYNSDGTEQWASIYNGPGQGMDQASSICVDEERNVYVTGWSDAVVGVEGNLDFATIKYNPDGQEVWVMRYNGTGDGPDYQTAGIVLDGGNNVFVTGSSMGDFLNQNFATIKYSQSPSHIKEINSEVPNAYSLFQNYPNPLNPSTKIEYSIPEHSLVQLSVYDVLGNEVFEIINEEQVAGTYRVDLNGAELPSGVYFYKLQAGSFVETKKMILLK